MSPFSSIHLVSPLLPSGQISVFILKNTSSFLVCVEIVVSCLNKRAWDPSICQQLVLPVPKDIYVHLPHHKRLQTTRLGLILPWSGVVLVLGV